MSMWFYLSFVLLILPLAANGNVVCVGHRNRTASSNYEANIRRLESILPYKTALTLSRSARHQVGKFPHGVYAASRCHYGTDFLSCRACVTFALRQAHTACPYHDEAVFSNRNCSLRIADLLSGNEAIELITIDSHQERFSVRRNLSMAMVFQAIGFAWLFFLLLQDWRDRKRRLHDAFQLSSN